MSPAWFHEVLGQGFLNEMGKCSAQPHPHTFNGAPLMGRDVLTQLRGTALPAKHDGQLCVSSMPRPSQGNSEP